MDNDTKLINLALDAGEIMLKTAQKPSVCRIP